jgi:hypothetical protein
LGGLENIANNFSAAGSDDADKALELRKQRWSRLGLLWEVSESERLRQCRRTTLGGPVNVHKNDDCVSLSGVVTCAKVWSCPLCSAKILAGRQTEVEQILTAHTGNGGSIVMGTLTMRHHKGQGLAELWDGLSKAWSRVLASRGWRRWKQRLGLLGQIRAVEVTYGQHGWHVHIHFFALVETAPSETELDAWRSEVVGLWANRLAKLGFSAVEQAQDMKLLTVQGAISELARYITKATYELTGAGLKDGRSTSSRTPWRVLDGFAETGDLDDLDLWREFEAASGGRRQMTGMGQLRRALGLAEDDTEATDEDLAAEDEGGDIVLRIEAESWRTLCAAPGDIGVLLTLVGRGPMRDVCGFLKARGVAYSRPG